MSGAQNQDQYLGPLRHRSRAIERGISGPGQREDKNGSPMPLRGRRGRRRHDPPQCGRAEESRGRSRSPRSSARPSQPSGMGNDRQSSRNSVREASQTKHRPSEGNASMPVPAASEPRSSEPSANHQLPSRMAKRIKRIEGLPSHPFTHNDELTSCPICMEPYVIGEQVTSLPCNHIYHWGCLTPWLRTSPRCPLCRRHCFN